MMGSGADVQETEASRFLELLFQAPCLPRIEMQPFDGC